MDRRDRKDSKPKGVEPTNTVKTKGAAAFGNNFNSGHIMPRLEKQQDYDWLKYYYWWLNVNVRMSLSYNDMITATRDCYNININNDNDIH